MKMLQLLPWWCTDDWGRAGEGTTACLRPWIARRPQLGDYENLMAELEKQSHGDFVAYLRMEPAMFHEIVQRLTPILLRCSSNYIFIWCWCCFFFVCFPLRTIMMFRNNWNNKNLLMWSLWILVTKWRSNAQTGLFIDGDMLQTERWMIGACFATTLQLIDNQSAMKRRSITAASLINHR